MTVLIGSLSWGAVTAVPILLKPISAEWGGDVEAASLIHTSAMIGSAFGGVALGRAADRFGFFAIAVVAAGATGLGLVLAATTSNLLILHLTFGMLVGGLGQGAFYGPMAGAVSLWFDRHRALAIAIAASGQGIGGLTVPPTLRWAAQEFGWRTALTVFGCVCLCGLTACSFVFRRKPPVRDGRADAGDEIHKRPSVARDAFGLLCICCALSNGAMFVVIGHLTAFEEERGIPAAAAAGVLSLMLGAALFSRLSMGAICARWGHHRALLGVSAVHALGVWILAVANSQALCLVGVVVIGIGFGGYLPGYAMTVREMFPEKQAGRRISEVYFLAFLAAGGGSWLGGWLRGIYNSYTLPFSVAAVAATTGALFLLFIGRPVQAAKS